MPDNPWEISINSFDGFVPGFWKNANSTYGNKGHASDMQNVDILDPNVLTQGPGLSTLTAGTQVGAVTTLIKGLQRISIDGTNAYAVGGVKFYKFTASAVTNAGIWPHSITAASGNADGEDVCYYNGKYFYSYNYTGAGDIGRYDGSSTFDDNYMSDIPTGKTTLVASVPHQMIVGGDDKMYITNGRYIASFDNTTFSSQALDFPYGSVVVSIAWEHNSIYALVNRPNLTTSSYMESSVYIWDTTSSSWSYEITVPGRGGALFAKNGIIYIWYKDVTSTGGFKLGYVNGNKIDDLANYTGSLPLYYQIIDHENHLLWLSSGEVWAWGAASKDLQIKLSQYADAGHATAGGITNVFGTPIVASNVTTSYKLAKFSGYDVNATWNTITFDVSSARMTSYIDRIVFLFEQLSTGAHRLDLDWSSGSATRPVKVRKILIAGHYITNQ